MQCLLDAAAAADMLAWDNSGFSIDSSVRITLIDHDMPRYFRSLEHLLRYRARPPFALERLSVIRGPDRQITRVRYVLPRHKAANGVGPGRGCKSTRPGGSRVVDLTPFVFLDRLADLVPPPRKHRHRYHGVFAPKHRLRKAVTARAIGNIGQRRDAATDGHGGDGHATEGCCDANPSHKPRSHDTPRIAWARLMARMGEEFPLQCPNCGGDIRVIAFITEPGPIRKILTHLGEPLEPPPLAPARGPPADWGQLVQASDERDVFQASPDELPVIDIHSLRPVPDARHQGPGRATRETVCAEARKSPSRRGLSGVSAFRETACGLPGRSPRGSRVAHQPGNRRGSAIGRTILILHSLPSRNCLLPPGATGGNAESCPGRRSPHPPAADLFHSLLVVLPHQPRRRHQAASRLPISEWTTLEIAHGTAASGSAGKCFWARTTPRPEFCMPTSIEIVRATVRS
jgi:hypothetical protein